MLLKNKIAVVHGGGGVIGGAIARAFQPRGAALEDQPAGARSTRTRRMYAP